MYCQWGACFYKQYKATCQFRGEPSNDLAMRTAVVDCVREFGWQEISLQLRATYLPYKDKLVCYLPVRIQDATEYCDLSRADLLGMARIAADT